MDNNDFGWKAIHDNKISESVVKIFATDSLILTWPASKVLYSKLNG